MWIDSVLYIDPTYCLLMTKVLALINETPYCSGWIYTTHSPATAISGHITVHCMMPPFDINDIDARYVVPSIQPVQTGVLFHTTCMVTFAQHRKCLCSGVTDFALHKLCSMKVFMQKQFGSFNFSMYCINIWPEISIYLVN